MFYFEIYSTDNVYTSITIKNIVLSNNFNVYTNN